MEIPAEIQVNNVQPPTPLGLSSSFATEGKQLCQARFALGESIMAFPNPLLHVSCDSS